jgi:hypothetical protein
MLSPKLNVDIGCLTTEAEYFILSTEAKEVMQLQEIKKRSSAPEDSCIQLL